MDLKSFQPQELLTLTEHKLLQWTKSSSTLKEQESKPNRSVSSHPTKDKEPTSSVSCKRMGKSILKIQIITKKYKLLQSMGIKADKKIILLYLVSGQIKALELVS
jgi:hypothetical protein